MKQISISDGEWKIMQLLWEQSPQTLGDMVEALKDETGWTKSTVYSMLKRLVEKGALRMEEGGRTQQYFPLIEKEEAASMESKSFLQKVYDGSLKMMVASLVDQNALSETEIAELYAILEKAEKEKGEEK